MKLITFFILLSLVYSCQSNSTVLAEEEFTEEGVKIKEVRIDSSKNWKQEKYWTKTGEILAIRTYLNDSLKGEFLQIYPDESKKVIGEAEGISLVPDIDSLTFDTIALFEVMNGKFREYKDEILIDKYEIIDGKRIK